MKSSASACFLALLGICGAFADVDQRALSASSTQGSQKTMTESPHEMNSRINTKALAKLIDPARLP